MKLLIITQKVDTNDPILGFFHAWIEEFSLYAERVSVICLEEGSHDLPGNVSVYSLGKEKGMSKARYVLNFYTHIWKHRREYDRVFVHMNPEYVLLGAPVFALLRKPVYLWYVHRQVNLKLRAAALLSKMIFTSNPESFRIKNKKVRYMGHGIDTQKFASVDPDFSGNIKIAHVGRITSIKRVEVFIRALKSLRESGVNAELRLVGDAVTDKDRAYEHSLKETATEEKVEQYVYWDGSKPAPLAFRESSITVNGAPNGGMDKAVLESLAARRPAFVTNVAFKPVYGDLWDTFSYEDSNSTGLAGKIKAFIDMDRTLQLEAIHALEEKVRVEYDVKALISRLIHHINGSHS
jgi:glycosyltransferase involved in cell wall biosynthesis